MATDIATTRPRNLALARFLLARLASSYRIKHSAYSYGSLVDRGAKGGLAGADIHILERTGRKVSVTGIDDHELPGLDLVTCVSLIQTNHGKVNMLLHEYAYYGRGNAIHSPYQIECFNLTILEATKSSPS